MLALAGALAPAWAAQGFVGLDVSSGRFTYAEGDGPVRTGAVEGVDWDYNVNVGVELVNIGGTVYAVPTAPSATDCYRTSTSNGSQWKKESGRFAWAKDPVCQGLTMGASGSRMAAFYRTWRAGYSSPLNVDKPTDATPVARENIPTFGDREREVYRTNAVIHDGNEWIAVGARILPRVRPYIIHTNGGDPTSKWIAVQQDQFHDDVPEDLILNGVASTGAGGLYAWGFGHRTGEGCLLTAAAPADPWNVVDAVPSGTGPLVAGAYGDGYWLFAEQTGEPGLRFHVFNGADWQALGDDEHATVRGVLAGSRPTLVYADNTMVVSYITGKPLNAKSARVYVTDSDANGLYDTALLEEHDNPLGQCTGL